MKIPNTFEERPTMEFVRAAKLIGIQPSITVIRHTEKLDLLISPEELAPNNQRN